MINTRDQEYVLTTNHNEKGGPSTVEVKDYHKNTEWYKQWLDHCESFGISITITNLFIHLQKEKHEQNYKKISNSWVPNKSDC